MWTWDRDTYLTKYTLLKYLNEIGFKRVSQSRSYIFMYSREFKFYSIKPNFILSKWFYSTNYKDTGTLYLITGI